MVKLEIMNHSRSCICGEYHWINPYCIQMICGCGVNIAGVKYVRMVFTPDIMRILPCDNTDGCVYVKGTVVEILNAIYKAKEEAK